MAVKSESVIPEEMTELPQWVVFRLEKGEDGKTTKRPYQPKNNNLLASSTNPATWGTFEQACEAVDRNPSLGGVGFVFTPADPFMGIDLDHCIKNGRVNARARKIIDRLFSYSEVSVSGDGVHVIVKASVPRGRKQGGLEMYSSGRYFTMTGNHLAGSPPEVFERQEEVDALYQEFFGEEEAREQTAPLPVVAVSGDDHALLQRAFGWVRIGHKIRSLYMEGKKDEYHGDDSAADLALCNYLAFLYGRDAVRMDRMFRASALYRHKWDEYRGELTYGQMTIQKAIASTKEVYSPGVSFSGVEFRLDTETGEIVAVHPDGAPSPLSVLEEFQAARVLIGRVMTDGVPEVHWLVEPVVVRGRIHLLYGEPESGKTILALSWVRWCIEHGLDVLFIDEESGGTSIASLLGAMGVDAALVDRHVHYFAFPGMEDSAPILAYADALQPAMVLFDSLTDMLSVAGLDENSGVQVTGWMLDVAQALARREYSPGVVLIDHVTKDASNTKYSVASRAKKAKSDVLWFVERDADFDKTKTTHVTLWRHKNRPGVLPKSVVYVVGGDDGRLVCEPFDADEHGAESVADASSDLHRWVTEMGGEVRPWEAMQHFNSTSERTVRRWAISLEERGLMRRSGEGKKATWKAL